MGTNTKAMNRDIDKLINKCEDAFLAVGEVEKLLEGLEEINPNYYYNRLIAEKFKPNEQTEDKDFDMWMDFIDSMNSVQVKEVENQDCKEEVENQNLKRDIPKGKIKNDSLGKYHFSFCLQEKIHCHVYKPGAKKVDSPIIAKINGFHFSNLTPGHTYTVICRLYNLSTHKYIDEECEDIEVKSYKFTAKSRTQKIKCAYKDKKTGELKLGELDYDLTGKLTKTTDFAVYISLLLDEEMSNQDDSLLPLLEIAEREYSVEPINIEARNALIRNAVDKNIPKKLKIKKSDLKPLIPFERLNDNDEVRKNILDALTRRDEARGILNSKSGLTREKVFMCAFAFNLNYEEVHNLMWHCLGEQDFNYKNPYEVIFVYCIFKHDGTLIVRFKELKDKYEQCSGIPNIENSAEQGQTKFVGDTLFEITDTGIIGLKIDNDEDLLKSLMELPCTNSNSAKTELNNIYEEIIESPQFIEEFEEYKEYKKSKGEGRGETRNMYLIRKIFGDPKPKKLKKNEFQNTGSTKSTIKLRIFDHNELKKMVDVTDKTTKNSPKITKSTLLIMIFFKYVYLKDDDEKTQWEKDINDYMERHDGIFVERVQIPVRNVYNEFSKMANDILIDAGFSEIYLPNIMERYIVYSLCSAKPLDTFQTFFISPGKEESNE